MLMPVALIVSSAGACLICKRTGRRYQVRVLRRSWNGALLLGEGGRVLLLSSVDVLKAY